MRDPAKNLRFRRVLRADEVVRLRTLLADLVLHPRFSTLWREDEYIGVTTTLVDLSAVDIAQAAHKAGDLTVAMKRDSGLVDGRKVASLDLTAYVDPIYVEKMLAVLDAIDVAEREFSK